MTSRQKALMLECLAGSAFTGAGLLVYVPLGLVILGCMALLAAWTFTSERT